MRKIRLFYKKLGRAVYISHLDIMRTFQRSLKRAGVDVKHTEGFNPHPYISIALPLSLGYNGECEFFDMVVLDDMPCEEIVSRLNEALPEGIEAVKAYEGGRPVREIAYSEYEISLEYDRGVSEDLKKALKELFAREEIVVVKKSKRGETETNIVPMIKKAEIIPYLDKVVIRCILAAGNTSLNPEYIVKAIEKYIPERKPDFAEFTRKNVLTETLEDFR